MSCKKSCPCQFEWPVDTHEPKLITREIDWLIFVVRRMSRLVVGKVNGQEAVWNKKYEPSWWDEHKYGEWKNPTTKGKDNKNRKDNTDDLLKKYKALKTHLQEENKFQTEFEEEAKLFEENRIEELLRRRNIIILCGALEGIITQLKKFNAQFPPCVWDKITKLLSTLNNDEQNGLNTDPESGSKLPILSSQSETQLAVSDSHCSSSQQSSVSFNSGELPRNIVSSSIGKQKKAGIDVPSCSRTAPDAFYFSGTGSSCQDADSSNDSLSSANHSAIPETSSASVPAVSFGRNYQTDSTISLAFPADLSSANGTSKNLKKRKVQTHVKGSKKARQQKFTPQSLQSTSKTSETEVFTTNHVPAVSRGHSKAAPGARSFTPATTSSMPTNKPTISPVTCNSDNVVSASTVKRSEAGIDFPSCGRTAPDAFYFSSTGSSCQDADSSNDSLSSANHSAIPETSPASAPAVSFGRNYQTDSTISLASPADLSSANGTSKNLKKRKVQTHVKGSKKARQQKFTPQSLQGISKTSERAVFTTNYVFAVPKGHSAATSDSVGTGINCETDSTPSVAPSAEVPSSSRTCPAKLDSFVTGRTFQNPNDSSEISKANVPSDGTAVSDKSDSPVRDFKNSDDSTIIEPRAEIPTGSKASTTSDGSDNVRASSDCGSPENNCMLDAGHANNTPMVELNQLFTEEEQHQLCDEAGSLLSNRFLNDMKAFLAENGLDVTGDSENCYHQSREQNCSILRKHSYSLQ